MALSLGAKISKIIAISACFMILALPNAYAQWATLGAACSPNGILANSDGFLVCSSGVWVANSLRPGSTISTCNSTNAGYIRYTGGSFQGCNGSTWVALASSGKPSSYAGVTGTTYTGSMGGVAGANAKCAAAYAGSRMMRFTEVVWFASSMAANGWVLDDAGTLDMANSGWGTTGGVGCFNLTSAHASAYGVIMNGTGAGGAAACSSSYGIHCVID